LQLFAEGGDNYCDFASLIFGRPVDKSMESERAVGKEAVLGCGYGMGVPRFAEGCAAKGVDLAAAGTSAEAVVNAYRNAYPAIAGRLVTDSRFPTAPTASGRMSRRRRRT
jgi:DNA polymerase